MAVALVALLVMRTVSSLHDDSGLDDDIDLHPVDFSLHEEDGQDLIQSGGEESDNDQDEDLRKITKPSTKYYYYLSYIFCRQTYDNLIIF